jgi:hypothetical protein
MRSNSASLNRHGSTGQSVAMMNIACMLYSCVTGSTVFPQESVIAAKTATMLKHTDFLIVVLTIVQMK